ncbi:MAG: hybrid sensor histidine kinase/response regulator [Desulfosoma sp.]
MTEEELMERLRHAFLGEARERLDSLTAHLEALERQDDFARRKESLEVAYREVHSLKGAARAVGFSDVEAVCQTAESVLSALKREQIPVSRDVLGALYQVLSFVEKAVQGEPDRESVSALCRRLESLLRTPSQEKASLQEDSVSPQKARLRGAETAAPDLCPPQASGAGTAPGAEPSQGPMAEAPRAFSETALSSGPASEKQAERAGDGGSEPDKAPVGRGPSGAPQGSYAVRVDVHRLDVFLKRAEELISAKLAMAQHLGSLKDLRRRFDHMKKQCTSGARELRWLKDSAHQDTGAAVSVPAKKVLELKRFMEENQKTLHALGEEVARAVASAEDNARYLATLVDELMEGAKEVLLQPFALVLRGLSRMVRDLAENLGKDVRLIVEGDDVEADRRILEELKDPLVHLLRNAVDHGLEKLDVRVAQGKPPQGTVRVFVVQEDARTVRVAVEDDGQGIDPDRLREEAVRRGLLSREEADQMADEAAVELIFRSDLSTSAMVTEVSGRGLGMAIVKERVEGLGGRLHVHTEKGRGTRMVMELPVSLATFRGILIGEAGRLFVMPTHAVEAVVRVRDGDCQRVEGRETLTHMDRVISVERLRDVLGLPDSNAEAPVDPDHRRTALILRAGDGEAAVEVDAVLGEQEVLIKGLGPQLQKVHHIWGATVLGSGLVVPVLNAADIIRSVRHKLRPSLTPAGVPKGSAPKSAARPRAVLVAEDSVTSRTLLKNILEGAGYAVQTAVDGQDALAKLREQPFDAVVSDVEMPRMNGFDLTRSIRREEKLKHMPVVLVTSLDSREHREQGLEAGADAYIVKSSFDQTTLLDVLERFTGSKGAP